MESRVDDADPSGLIFSRDCAEYEVATASGAELLLLVNYLRSKGFGSQGHRTRSGAGPSATDL
jgi:hypothetical protein